MSGEAVQSCALEACSPLQAVQSRALEGMAIGVTTHTRKLP